MHHLPGGLGFQLLPLAEELELAPQAALLEGQDPESAILFWILLTFGGTQVNPAWSSGLVGCTSCHGLRSWHEGDWEWHDKQWMVDGWVREGCQDLGA